MLSKVFETSVNYLQVLDENGKLDPSTAPKDLDDKKVIDMYKLMCFARSLDAKVLSLQRQGRAVTYAPLIGQEGEQIGSAYAMRKQDFFVPNFRQHGVYLARNFPIDTFALYWKGFEEGGIIPKDSHAFPVIVPVATQIPHAVGVAFAQKYKNTNAAVVTYVGDGGTSEGDFYEGMNFAGALGLHVIFVIENNQWAISVPRTQQTAAKTLAQKAVAAGIDCMQVDGNDAIAVYKAVSDAINNPEKKPMVIECLTYRMSLHTTADDPTKYRPDSAVEAWKPKDPILRVRKYLQDKGAWDDAKQSAMEDEQSKIISAAVEKSEQFKPDPKSMFQNVYSFMPDVLKEEFDDAVANNFWQG